jgi:RHS repeat-associated protein
LGCLKLEYYQNTDWRINYAGKELTSKSSSETLRSDLPFGELFVEQRSTANYYTPYKFSGKEKDEETSYSYFGARYYMSDVSVWLSVDPLKEKYPNISPYAYCNLNPIRYIDPDGMGWVDGDGKPIKEEQKSKIKVYIFYDPSNGGFKDQAMKYYKQAEEKYGKGTVAMSNVMTEAEFKQDWKDMEGGDIKEVNLYYHGSNQQIHLNWETNEYIVSTGNGQTNKNENSGTDIKSLPSPCGSILNATLNINSCHSNDKEDKDMPLKGSGLTLAEGFRKYTNFNIIRATSGAVNYDNKGNPYPQWYYGKGWEYLCRRKKN